MSFRAPVRVPVELSGGTRWFRLAHGVSPDGVRLGQPVPEALEGAFQVAFHLPGDARAVRCRARAEEVVVGEGDTERAERRELVFLDLDEDARARILAYVQERLGIVKWQP